MKDTADRNNTHAEDEGQYSLRLEDYLTQLEGREAWREFQERYLDKPGYYELLASLLA
ncbi:MAG TPA: hypothetical protein VFI90_16270 [Rubrobacter sp.]|nr:hypothetical protein [Rubrobacter sp.]